MHIGYKLSQITIRTNNFNPHRPPKPNSDEVFFYSSDKGAGWYRDLHNCWSGLS